VAKRKLNSETVSAPVGSRRSSAFLRETREQAGLTQAGLAKLSGVSRAVISDLESWRTFFSSLDYAQKLYRVLEASGSEAARDALAVVLGLRNESAQREIESCDRDIFFLNKRRKGIAKELAEIKSEEKRLARKTR
jgi:transcriptional regulator with XRE-family HTH domain